MSVRMLGLVWRVALPTYTKVALLALADAANDEGENIFPGLRRLVAMTGASRRTVQVRLHELERLGLLVQVAPASERRPARYRFHLAHLRALADSGARPAPQARNGRGARQAPEGCTPRPVGVQLTTRRGARDAPNPSVPVKDPSGRNRTEIPSKELLTAKTAGNAEILRRFVDQGRA